IRLTDQSVALIVKRCANAAGLQWEKYAGHSLRSGLATAAAMADVSERSIMAQTGHKSLPVVRRYIRDGSVAATPPRQLVCKSPIARFRVVQSRLIRHAALVQNDHKSKPTGGNPVWLEQGQRFSDIGVGSGGTSRSLV